ncbi:hypothetical protein A3C91_02775 [Candidatus Azambacteria bacterium RIFCSPHIGHO2_02_FULL_52_12]|uniref:Uncharacterized protein n=1 Tax=Candidatus Azambacteria bacterium RIFCSPLOWO2_01_FULL_46_25 TaxID=1797298 RepID=A0A1F5BTH7_9BACT|nr:MAG: hypothetical protein A3C91_02775 [Candidatus Azambacteria bacterium RIFCSPHIGHO2_02_FULL_52_12]OGD33900.1 MAG: hypothetical protein A2988_00190 [Candidatus Azambacteria bacterium RIFCSPLOWO2_01_FULL_46_25]OGD37155.1 MAG: hypothetical protein A2850_04260 [Candidatus Azambacteria bacterium RIFCSPHIGHO2_01_FULL_51_74]
METIPYVVLKHAHLIGDEAFVLRRYLLFFLPDSLQYVDEEQEKNRQKALNCKECFEAFVEDYNLGG